MHGPFRDMQTHGLCFQILKSCIYSFPKGIPLRTDLPVHADCSLVTQSCLTHCNAMDCSPPGSSVHEISQTRLLEWVAISFSRGSSQPRDQTHVTCIGREVEHLGTLVHWWYEWKLLQPLWKHFAVLKKKIKYKITIWSNTFTSRYILEPSAQADVYISVQK